MGAMKRQVSDVLDLWAMGATIARISKVTGLTPDMVEYMINEFGMDDVAISLLMEA